MAEQASPTDPAQGHGRKLDDIMLAMDVVDTLRHSKSLVDRELGGEGRDAVLIERLREIYAAQGIDVPDSILIEGVDALKRQRFSYVPAKPGFATSLARIYVKRTSWSWPLGIGLAVVVLLWGGYHFLVDAPRDAAQARQTIELTQEIPAELAKIRAEIDSLALVERASEKARALAEDGLAAAKSGDMEAARAAQQGLRGLREKLVQTYNLRIVSRPGEPSGVWRIPDANSSARNYYLVVEAVDSEGKVVPVRVTSEEDGTTRSATKWGLRVERGIYDAVRADKSDDGIIQNNRVGVKRRGYLEPEYAVPTTAGAILEW